MAKDRELLGVVRVAHYVDRHLNWGRGSALTQYTDDIDNLTPIFADVRRHTRSEFKKREFPKLSQAAADLALGASKLGVRLQHALQPGLDLGALQSSAAAVGLFDGDIPTRQMGLGSRRLLTITMQLGRTDENSLLLLDEIESALEPYRIRSLIRALLDSGIQVIATTHSPVAVQESSDQSLFFCRRKESDCQVLPLDADIKAILKTRPGTLLSRHILICEGKTEIGFLMAAKEKWRSKHDSDLDILGIGEVYAEGRTQCGHIAKHLLALGIPCAIFADSDEPVNLSAQERGNSLLRLIQYAQPMSSEQALFASLGPEGYVMALAAIDSWHTGLRGELRTRFAEPSLAGKLLGTPLDGSKSEAEHLTELALECNWIKKQDRSEAVLASAWDVLTGPLEDALKALEAWCYGPEPS